MANSTTKVWIFICALFHPDLFQFVVCSENLIPSTRFQVPPIFGQNLTGEIDRVVKENDFTYKLAIQKALKWSPIVYYESDILLDEIEEIIPVIELLNQLKPNGSLPVKVTLSLPYLNKTNGSFIWRRMKDIYYSLKLNISVSNKTKILSTLASITLKFVSPHQQGNYYFNNGHYLNDFVITNYVKNFVSFNFGEQLIPVGVMWDKNMLYIDLVQREISQADFLIFSLDFNSANYFPTILEQFDADIKTALYTVPKNVSLFFRELDRPTRNVNNVWNNDRFDNLREAVRMEPQGKNLSEKFVTNINRNSNQLWPYLVLAWANLENRDVIIGTALQNRPSELFPKHSSRIKLIMPFIKIQEVKKDNCQLKIQFTRWSSNYQAIVLDEKSWRTLARFQAGLEHDGLQCNGSVLQSNQSINVSVFIHFTNGIAGIWDNLEESMKELIYPFPKIEQLYLDTLIFYEQDLKQSLKIQQLITSAKNIYKIGCSTNYESIISAFSRFSIHNDQYIKFKVEVEGSLCQPVFPMLDVMIWYAPQYEINDYSDYSKNQLFSSYSNIFLLRKLFQNTFPHIKVYIQFLSNVDKRILADLYNATIIVPSDQILY